MIQKDPKARRATRDGSKLQVGAMLVNRELLTRQQLDEALELQESEGRKKLLGEILIELGYVTEEQVIETLADAYGVPYAAVNPKIADPRVIETLPREFLESQVLLPMFLVRNRLTVAVTEPANLFLVEEIARLSGYEVQIVASTAECIQNTLRQYLPNANVFVIDDIYEELDPSDFSVVERQITELADLEEVAGHSPVVKLVNYIIYSGVNDSASDIHIEPDDGQVRVRFRLDGRLYQKLNPPPAMLPAIVSRIKIMAGLDISERRLPQDGDIHVRLDGRAVDLRVSTMPEKAGEKVVIRIIDSASTVVGLDRLGFSGPMLPVWRDIVNEPNGVVLVTGPTGSGKSTTLYSVMSELDSDQMNISTVEDPVEAGLAGINQFQVNDRAGFGFAEALRSLLRQDPDIIMVGEIRDTETARIVVQSALTGHLVLSTLHTNDAPSAVTRLVNLGLEPYLIAAILRGVLAQRLVRKICVHCKEEYEPEAGVRDTVEKLVGSFDKLSRGLGCGKCRNTGYSGRIGIFELFVPNDEILDAISEGMSLHDLRLLLNKHDFVSLRDDGLRKAIGGLTSVEEVLYVTSV